jgi:hypothetical protein
MDIEANVNGTWKTALNPFVNVSGTWKQIQQGWVNVSGTWRQFYQNYVPISATGGTVTTTTLGGVPYKVHTFTGSGTFSVSSIGTTSGKVKAFIVAGGGMGGNSAVVGDSFTRGGGGGAGGVIQATPTIGSGDFSVTVGAGGIWTDGHTAVSGQNSSVFGLTAIGGGYGGTSPYIGNSPSNAASGGSGGGAYGDGALGPVGVVYGGSGTSGQGNSGGNGWRDGGGYDPPGYGGSGGGAGSAGLNYNQFGSFNTGLYGGNGISHELGGTYARGGSVADDWSYALSVGWDGLMYPTANSGNGGMNLYGYGNPWLGEWLNYGSSGKVIVYYPTDRSL